MSLLFGKEDKCLFCRRFFFSLFIVDDVSVDSSRNADRLEPLILFVNTTNIGSRRKWFLVANFTCFSPPYKLLTLIRMPLLFFRLRTHLRIVLVTGKVIHPCTATFRIRELMIRSFRLLITSICTNDASGVFWEGRCSLKRCNSAFCIFSSSRLMSIMLNL